MQPHIGQDLRINQEGSEFLYFTEIVLDHHFETSKMILLFIFSAINLIVDKKIPIALSQSYAASQKSQFK